METRQEWTEQLSGIKTSADAVSAAVKAALVLFEMNQPKEAFTILEAVEDLSEDMAGGIEEILGILSEAFSEEQSG